MSLRDGRARVVVQSVEPSVGGGRYPARGIVGEPVLVEADAFADGHDQIRLLLLHRRKGRRTWIEAEMQPLSNDRWRGAFPADGLGRYQFRVEGWIDRFRTWQRDMFKRVAADQVVDIELRAGAEIVAAAASRADASSKAAKRLLGIASETLAGGAPRSDERWARVVAAETEVALPDGLAPYDSASPDDLVRRRAAAEPRVHIALSAALRALVDRFPDRTHATRSDPVLEVRIDRERARFSSWYEFFPRSCGEAGRHGTFEDCIERLDYVAEMGFDVVYLPPIHPIGETKRKGRNNAVEAAEGDVGSPWAIGSSEGGHKAIHPELGNLKSFRRLVKAAEKRGMEIALDIAFQVSPDHPYVEQHPEWFRSRPDGTIQYAENPPKKYEDIYPFDFETENWQELWRELKSVFDFWIEQGVKIFRVDNPHTKAFAFWQWCIGELEREHPEVILLAEAFTRPKVMYHLARLGYHQSYTYFAWRYSKDDFEQYLEQLTAPPISDFFRPNFWPNTPDILTEQLQVGGRSVFMQRLVLAATLSSNYGIYGPAFELVETRPREPHSEEYLDSEKYQLRDWNLGDEWSLARFIARVNAVRHEHAALQRNDTLRFVNIDNDMLLAYVKSPPAPGSGGTILTVVNLDAHHMQSGWLELPLADLGMARDGAYEVRDLLSGDRYRWHGARNYIELNPQVVPAHMFVLQAPTHGEEGTDAAG